MYLYHQLLFSLRCGVSLLHICLHIYHVKFLRIRSFPSLLSVYLRGSSLMDRQIDRQSNGQTDTDRHMDRQTNSHMDRQTGRHIDRQADGQTDRQTHSQTHRQTDAQHSDTQLNISNSYRPTIQHNAYRTY